MSNTIFHSIDPTQLFSDYLRVTGIAHLGPEPSGVSGLVGKRLGLLNGSSWITLWSNYFGRLYLPGVHLVNAGNEAVQLNFMAAHQKGLPSPPQSNIEAFIRYARDLVELAQVDLVLITCSTMNRAYPQVADALQPYAVPVLQIDQPMMERAVVQGGKILVVATHGPTVNSTRALLQETASRLGKEVAFSGTTVEAAWECLAAGDVPVTTSLLPRPFTLTWIVSRPVAWSWPNYRWHACFFLIPIPFSNLAFPSIRAPNAASKKSVKC